MKYPPKKGPITHAHHSKEEIERYILPDEGLSLRRAVLTSQQ